MKTEWFLDGYVEWTGHDEDGPIEGFAEVTEAKLQDATLDVTLAYDDSTYEVHLERGATSWAGKYCRKGPTPQPVFGKCTAVAIPGEGLHRRFEGSWIEDGIQFRWGLVLRAGTRGSRRTNSARPQATAPPPRPQPGALTNEATKEKVRRVIRALEDVVAGRASSPQLVDEALRVHAILERGAKRRRRRAWP